MALIAINLRGSLWIDCTDDATEGKWVCYEDEAAGSVYRKWAKDQPNNESPGGFVSGVNWAALTKEGVWGDYVDHLLHSVCEMKPACKSSLQCRLAHTYTDSCN